MLDLDEMDWSLLRHLQRNGRITNRDLASAVGLSPSSCHGRVKRLEGVGAIEGYRAILDWRLLGQGFDAWAEIVVRPPSLERVEAFATFLAEAPAVASAQRLAQPNAFLIHVLAHSAESWRQFLNAAERAGFAIEVARFNLALGCVKAASTAGPPLLRSVA